MKFGCLSLVFASTLAFCKISSASVSTVGFKYLIPNILGRVTI